MGVAVASFFSRDDIDFSAPGMVNEVIDNLTPELKFVEDTATGLYAAMTGRTPEQIKAAKAQLGNVGGEPYLSWYGFPAG